MVEGVVAGQGEGDAAEEESHDGSPHVEVPHEEVILVTNEVLFNLNERTSFILKLHLPDVLVPEDEDGLEDVDRGEEEEEANGYEVLDGEAEETQILRPGTCQHLDRLGVVCKDAVGYAVHQCRRSQSVVEKRSSKVFKSPGSILISPQNDGPLMPDYAAQGRDVGNVHGQVAADQSDLDGVGVVVVLREEGRGPRLRGLVWPHSLAQMRTELVPPHRREKMPSRQLLH